MYAFVRASSAATSLERASCAVGIYFLLSAQVLELLCLVGEVFCESQKRHHGAIVVGAFDDGFMSRHHRIKTIRRAAQKGDTRLQGGVVGVHGHISLIPLGFRELYPKPIRRRLEIDVLQV